MSHKSSSFPYIESIFIRKTVFNESASEIPLDSNISLREAKLLNHVVKEIKPVRSAEIGFAQGISTLSILDGIKTNGSGYHSVIDPYQYEYQNSGIEMVKRADLNEYYKFYQDFPENIIPKLSVLDFVFIDASHLFGLSMLDFIFSNRVLKVGGIVGFHDLDMKSINKLITYVLKNYDYKILKMINNNNIYKRKFLDELFDSPRNFLRTIFYELKKPIRYWGIGNLIFIQKTGLKSEEYRNLKDF